MGLVRWVLRLALGVGISIGIVIGINYVITDLNTPTWLNEVLEEFQGGRRRRRGGGESDDG